jgi:hypothetical protein
MKSISLALASTACLIVLSACDHKEPQPAPPKLGIEQLVSKGRLNFATYEISRLFETCPSRFRRYLVGFKSSVRFDVDLEKTPLKIKPQEGTIPTKYIVTAPAITIGNVESGGSGAWVLNGSLIKNDEAQALRAKDLIVPYSLYLAEQQLGTEKLQTTFTNKIKDLVIGISVGLGTDLKPENIEVQYAKGEPASHPMPELKLCEKSTISW